MSMPHIKERQLPSTSQEPNSYAFLPPKARLSAAGVVIIALTLLILGKLFLLQIVSPDKYLAWGEAQRSRDFTITAPRGDILDRNTQPLAVSLKVKTIWADPQLVQDSADAARQLAPVLDMSHKELHRLLEQDTRFVYLKRKVSNTVSTRVSNLHLPGIYSLSEFQRHTPFGENLGLSVVGFVGTEEQGLGGLEHSFDDLLTGKSGEISFEANVYGNVVDPGLVFSSPAQQGTNLLLTLDKDIQYESERLIKNAVTEYEALGGTVLVSNPKTGEILAMATALGTEENGAHISDDNRAVTWAFEPGSAMKPFSLAGIFETNIGEPSSIREIPDRYFLYDSEFRDHIEHEPEEWSISDIITISSNIGTIFWTEDLGKAHLNHYLNKFGFGRPTNIELPGESEGILLSSRDYSGTSLATIALGQGISVTPLQLLYAYNTIANDGVYIPPSLVLATQHEDGDWISHPKISEPRRVISANSARDMSTILTRVVTEGTGKAANNKHYTVAGKTGTARKPQPTGGYVDADGNFHYITTFAGYFPAEDPEVSIIVVIDEPQNSIYASTTATPIFADLVNYIGGHLRITPKTSQQSINQISLN